MNINNNNQKKTKLLEKIKWLLIFVLLCIYFLSTYYLYKNYFFTHIIILFSLIGIGMSILLSTTQGKNSLVFLKKSYNEMQKIIWPQYKETLYTTFIIIIVTILISLILWSLDSIIFRLITFIISLRF
ncbi:preprotein translocase subunit SecE [Buchnera aphidicola]|uniref:preprotein translocase subunit SecE n=1 Tax=Buchnera aphidicola TaxID=9 RepID=UPI0034643FAE